jgi:hypothetical protein
MRAYRSPLKLFVFGIVGIVLMAAASDVLFGHWVSTPPDNNDGVLTTRGQAQQRGDFLWGGALLATGVLIFGGSVIELVRRKPAIAVSGAGVRLDTGGADDGLIPWAMIDEVSSGTISDPYDGSTREQLIIELKEAATIPDGLPGTTRNGQLLYVDAHDLASRVTEIALQAQGAHDHFLRLEAVRSYEPPSMVWDTTIDQDETMGAPVEDEGGGESKDADSGELHNEEIETEENK